MPANIFNPHSFILRKNSSSLISPFKYETKFSVTLTPIVTTLVITSVLFNLPKEFCSKALLSLLSVYSITSLLPPTNTDVAE